MSDRLACPYCSDEQLNADRLIHHFRRCTALRNNKKTDYTYPENSSENVKNVNMNEKRQKSTPINPLQSCSIREKKRDTTGNSKKKSATRTLKSSQRKKRISVARRNTVRRAPKSLFSKRRRAVKSGKRKRVVERQTSVSCSRALALPARDLVTTCPSISQTLVKSRLKSIPSDVQLNATAQKLQAQATLIKRLLQENRHLTNKEAVASRILEKVKLEKEELERESSSSQDHLKALKEELEKAKQKTEHEKLETAGVRRQLDAAILEKSYLQKQLQASVRIRSAEVNKIREELSKTQRQLKAANKRCEESKNSSTAASSLEKQRLNTYTYPHLRTSSQMFPVYHPRRAYAVPSSTSTPIQIVSSARSMPPKAVWTNYQNTNPAHDNRRRTR